MKKLRKKEIIGIKIPENVINKIRDLKIEDTSINELYNNSLKEIHSAFGLFNNLSDLIHIIKN